MDKKTIDTYNKMAGIYDEETSGFWDNFPKSFFNFFVDRVKNKRRVLNIGSGPGRDGLILKEKGLNVLCLDASEEMVEMSSSKGLESILGDFNNLTFSDNSFDGVWAYTSLLHIPKKDIDKSLSEIRRVLKKGGVFALGLIEGDGEEYRKSSEIDMLRLFSFYRKEEIEDILKRNGFEVIYFEDFKPKSKRYLNFISVKL